MKLIFLSSLLLSLLNDYIIIIITIIIRKGLFRYKVFLYRAFILEQSSLDEMKGI